MDNLWFLSWEEKWDWHLYLVAWPPALLGHIPLSWFLSHLIQNTEESAEPNPLEQQRTKGKTFSYNQCCSIRLESAHDWGFCLHKRFVKRVLPPAFQSGSSLCLASYWLLRNLQSLGLGAAWDKGKWMSILLELALIFKIVKSCRMKICIFKSVDTKQTHKEHGKSKKKLYKGKKKCPVKTWIPLQCRSSHRSHRFNLLPWESHDQRSLAGYSPLGRKKLDTTDTDSLHL